MQWNDREKAGFSSAGGNQPWLPVNDNFDEVNVAAQLQEPGSMLNLYRHLLSIRKSSPPLQIGSYHPFNNIDKNCYAYRRILPGHREHIVLLNFSPDRITVNLGQSGQARVQLSTYLDRDEHIDLSQVYLREHEGVVVEKAE